MEKHRYIKMCAVNLLFVVAFLLLVSVPRDEEPFVLENFLAVKVASVGLFVLFGHLVHRWKL